MTNISESAGNDEATKSDRKRGSFSRWVPLAIFLVLVVFLYVGLFKDPRDIPSVLIGKPAPQILLPDLMDLERQVDSSALDGKVWLLNVWGTWCPECWKEHEFLNYLAKREGVPIFGIDWRDEAQEAQQFLLQKGNPFVMVGFDPSSKAIMDWGVYGAPETFLIDKSGVIRWKHKGAMTPEVWRDQLKPLMTELEAK